MGCWILILGKASITHFPSATPIAGSQRSYAQMCDSKVNTISVIETPSTTESTHMSISHVDEYKSRDIVPLEVHEQEEYLNLQSQYISTAAVEATLAEMQQVDNLDQEYYEDEQEVQEVANTENVVRKKE